jgi:hypothetical protein
MVTTMGMGGMAMAMATRPHDVLTRSILLAVFTPWDLEALEVERQVTWGFMLQA